MVAPGGTDPSAPPNTPLLELEDVAVSFGGLQALRGVDLTVGAGERMAVLGPNGAGKTTLFNVIAGDLVPTRGVVRVMGVDCTLRPSRTRPALGVSRTYQKTRLFPGLTVADNLYLAQTGKTGRHLALWPNRVDARFRAVAAETATRVWLEGRLDLPVADLSHGEQRQLEIGLALVTEPKLMMLDEPASGLSGGERERLVELLEGLEEETTVLLIEHDMDVALRVAERVVVMAEGEVVAEGSPDQIGRDPVVQTVYLGYGDDEPAEPGAVDPDSDPDSDPGRTPG